MGRVWRWGGVPRSIRVAVAVLVGALMYGGAVHVVQVVGGGYPWAPTSLAVYFVALTVLDPVAAVLLVRRRVSGLSLAAFVFVTDAVANGYAAYGLGEGGIAARVAQGVITCLAVGSVVIAVVARPYAVRGRRSRPTYGGG